MLLTAAVSDDRVVVTVAVAVAILDLKCDAAVESLQLERLEIY